MKHMHDLLLYLLHFPLTSCFSYASKSLVSHHYKARINASLYDPDGIYGLSAPATLLIGIV